MSLAPPPASLARTFRTHLAHFLSGKTEREKMLLLALLLFLLATGLFQGIFAVIHERERLEKMLPRLQAQAQEVRQLQQALQNAPPPSVANTAVPANQHLSSLPAGLQGEWNGQETMVVRGTGHFQEWIRWSATLHREAGIALSRCQITQKAGGVEIEAHYRMDTAGTP